MIDRARRTERLGGILLLAATAAAIVLANSPASRLYEVLLDTPLEVRLGGLPPLGKPLLAWINDGLMTLFFLQVGLELKHHLTDGQLAGWRRIALPAGAALGGVVVPIGIYLVATAGDAVRREGWAIPGATDIAFALGVLALLGDRVAPALRTFLLTLAVIDDIVAIVVIAVYYNERVAWGARGLALAAVVALLLLNRLRVARYGVYLVVGALLWLFVLQSGIHATLAGVVLGLVIPRRPESPLGHSPMRELDAVLRPWVAFVILPAFAFANAGVSLRALGPAQLLDPVTLGIGLGLAIGKPLGVFGATWLLLRTGVAAAPPGANRRALFGVACLTGIGFTMSLFLGVLAFESAPRDFALPIRLGVLGGSVIAGGVGVLLLRTGARGGDG